MEFCLPLPEDNSWVKGDDDDTLSSESSTCINLEDFVSISSNDDEDNDRFYHIDDDDSSLVEAINVEQYARVIYRKAERNYRRATNKRRMLTHRDIK